MNQYTSGDKAQEVESRYLFIRLLRVFDDSKKPIRGVFKKGVASTKSGTFASLWLDWGKKFGNLSTIDTTIAEMKKLILYDQTNLPEQQPV